MEQYIKGLCLLGNDVRINVFKILSGEVNEKDGDKVVALANEMVDSLRTNKSRAKELLERFRKDFEYALTDDTFHHDDVKCVLKTLDHIEATYLS